MTTAELVADLQRQGFTLIPLPEGKLAVKPAEKLTDSLRDTIRQRKAEVLALLTTQQQPTTFPGYRALYQQTAEAIAGEYWSIDPAWLLTHPGFYKQIKALDDRLTTMERMGASEPEYCATLARLVRCVQDARAEYEREQEQSRERPVQ